MPESWQTPEVWAVLNRDFTVTLNGLELVLLHSHLFEALRHPKNIGPARGVTWGILIRIEELLVDQGVPPPPYGWQTPVRTKIQ